MMGESSKKLVLDLIFRHFDAVHEIEHAEGLRLIARFLDEFSEAELVQLKAAQAKSEAAMADPLRFLGHTQWVDS